MSMTVRNILTTLGGAAVGYICLSALASFELFRPAGAGLWPVLLLVFIIVGAIAGRLLAFRPWTPQLLRTLYFVGLALCTFEAILHRDVFHPLVSILVRLSV